MVDARKRTFFDDLSARWDGFTNHDRVRAALRDELARMRLVSHEHVVDLGCGTGNLTAVLLESLGPRARITAVDLSPEMIAKARLKFSDPRIHWCVADAASLPLPPESVDRVICFSAWPHFHDPAAVLKEMNRILRIQGTLVILHIDGRVTINQIHASSGEAIAQDVLLPATELAALFPDAGFVVEESDDGPARYCVLGRKIWNAE